MATLYPCSYKHTPSTLCSPSALCSPSTLRVPREPCQEGRQKSLSWIQPGSSRAALPSRAKSSARADGVSRAPTAHGQRHHHHTARSGGGGPKQGHPNQPGSVGWENGRCTRCPRHAERDGREQGEVRGFPENKAAAGSRHCWRWEGEFPAPAPAGVGKRHKKAPGVCVLSPRQPRPRHRPRPKHVGGELRAGAAASHMCGVTSGECHSHAMGWPRTQSRAGGSPCPGSTVALL